MNTSSISPITGALKTTSGKRKILVAVYRNTIVTTACAVGWISTLVHNAVIYAALLYDQNQEIDSNFCLDDLELALETRRSRMEGSGPAIYELVLAVFVSSSLIDIFITPYPLSILFDRPWPFTELLLEDVSLKVNNYTLQ